MRQQETRRYDSSPRSSQGRNLDHSVKRISAALRKKARKYRLLLLDVDGVLTDGRIIIDDRGVETKQFHVRDGQGISLLLRRGD